MPGLNLGVMGGVRATSGNGFSSTPNPSSATEAAFGPGYGGTRPSMTNVFMPNDAFGIAFWGGILAIAGLIFIRHSLPG